MKWKHVQFKLEAKDYEVVESIASKMGLSVGRAARHLTIAGARVTAGMEKPPAELLSSLHHDVEEFRVSLETLNESASEGIDGLRRDVQSVDKLLVALLRGMVQVVTIARYFGQSHNEELLDKAVKSAEQSLKASLQELRTSTTKPATEHST